MASSTSVSSFPLNIGTAQEFARVPSLLYSASYNEVSVCDLLKIRQMSDAGREPGNVGFECLKSFQAWSSDPPSGKPETLPLLDNEMIENAEVAVGAIPFQPSQAIDAARRTASVAGRKRAEGRIR